MKTHSSPERRQALLDLMPEWARYWAEKQENILRKKLEENPLNTGERRELSLFWDEDPALPPEVMGYLALVFPEYELRFEPEIRGEHVNWTYVSLIIRYRQ